MAIFTTTPVSGDPFGPGFQIVTATDTIGPFPPGTFWEFSLTAPANEDIVADLSFPLTGPATFAIMKNGTLTTSSIRAATPAMVNGVSGQLRITINEPGSGVVEQQDIPIVLDRLSGQSQELAGWITDNGSLFGQGLTEDEHNAVLQTNVGVIAMAGINPLELVGDLAAALGSSAPLAFGSLGDLMGPLVGDGTLSGPPALHIAMGVYWVATTIPIGLGHRHGQSEEYPARLVQWRTTHVVGGIEMCTEIVDATTHRELWKFRTQTPHAIQYSVLPGVEIFARYWLFP